MHEQEIQLQIKNFRKGASYREVKAGLAGKYNDMEVLQITGLAFKAYRRRKARGFIIYGVTTIALTLIYHIFYQELKPFRLYVAVGTSLGVLGTGLYQRYRRGRD